MRTRDELLRIAQAVVRNVIAEHLRSINQLVDAGAAPVEMDALCVKIRTEIATALPDDLQLDELRTLGLMLKHRLEQAGAKALAMRDSVVTEQGLEELIRHLN